MMNKLRGRATQTASEKKYARVSILRAYTFVPQILRNAHMCLVLIIKAKKLLLPIHLFFCFVLNMNFSCLLTITHESGEVQRERQSEIINFYEDYAEKNNRKKFAT